MRRIVRLLAAFAGVLLAAGAAEAACSTTTLPTGASANLVFGGGGTFPLMNVYDAVSGLCGTFNADTGFNVHIVGSALPSTGSAFGSGANPIGADSSGNLTAIIQADTSAAINISTATTTQLVALSSGKKIYVTAWDVIAGGTGNITLEYGTGSTCGTGTTALTGAYPLTAQAGLTKGNGLAPIFIVPASNALCALTSAAVQMSGSVSYTQF